MSVAEMMLVALSLSLDAVAISVAAGSLGTLRARRALAVAGTFGAFQAIMPVLGWAGGLWAREYLLAYGAVIGFALLLAVGLKMVKGGLDTRREPGQRDLLRPATLLALGVATSIDALVVGITFNFIPVHVPAAAASIGGVTFALSLAGLYVGGKSRGVLGGKAEAAGGIVLILLAFKTLLLT